MITAERLREVLSYNPETGVFVWRVTLSATGVAGSIAGSPHIQGYTTIQVDRSRYLSHRLAWLYMNGEWPKAGIDHINGVKNDNRIANLREANQAQNMQNMRSVTKRSKSGVMGVSWDKPKWVARLTMNRKSIVIGRFDKIEEASNAYLEAKRRLHAYGTI